LEEGETFFWGEQDQIPSMNNFPRETGIKIAWTTNSQIFDKTFQEANIVQIKLFLYYWKALKM
jgi:hypothetical protein